MLAVVAGGFFCRAGVTVANLIVLLTADGVATTALVGDAGACATGTFSTLQFASGAAGFFSSTLGLGTVLFCAGAVCDGSLGCSTTLVGAGSIAATRVGGLVGD